MRGGGLGERERPVDLDAHAAACDPLEQIGDHRVDARVLRQQRPTEKDAAQGIVLRPQILRLDLEPPRPATPTLTSVPR